MTTELAITTTPGVKMMFLIKRRPTSSREELLVHWFANHMPQVIRALEGTASRYTATLYEPDRAGNHDWDGVAQIQMAEAMAVPDEPFGTVPSDSFQERAAPYLPWATREYVVIDGSEHLPVRPLTLNAPFPTTRSGFFKVSFLVKAKPDTDYAAFFDHWLSVHAPNVARTMNKVGGLHYAVSHSLDPAVAPYAGMAEIYFRDPSGWQDYKQTIEPDGMEEWAANEGTLILRTGTELVGIY